MRVGRRVVGRVVRAALRPAGLTLASPAAPSEQRLPRDLDAFTQSVVERVRPYTLTSPERVAALVEAVRYLVRHDVPGAFVECGVWRGGSAQAVLLTLLDLGVTDREVWLYDTFDAMPPPGPEDIDILGVPAAENHARLDAGEPIPPEYAYLPRGEVHRLLVATGYPAERLRLVVGLVEDTVPAQVPAAVALLRLDTDYYASTRHELEHLVPLVPDGGVLIVDDYGHFLGARQAVDEYLAATGLPLLLHRIDYSGRAAVVRRPGGSPAPVQPSGTGSASTAECGTP